VLVTISAGACGSPATGADDVDPRRPAVENPALTSSDRGGVLRGAQIELDHGPEFVEIADLAYRRSTGGGRLLALCAHDSERVRLRAVEAAGRLPFPAYGAEVTNVLSERMQDPVPAVRHAAAFALGLRGDPQGAGTLASYRNDGDPEMRARVVEAASRLPDTRLHRELLLALRDTDPRVRIEAAIATARWDPLADDAEEVDRALLDALRPYQLRPSLEGSGRIEPEFVWRVLYALSQRRAKLGRGAFLEYASAPGALERLFAVRGLASITVDDETGLALARALADPASDWRAAYEAAQGLGSWADPRALPALFGAVEHESAHVRGAALAALGSFPARREEVLPYLRRGQLDVSAEVRVESLTALAKLLPVPDALDLLGQESRREDAVLRAGVATICASVPDPGAAEILRKLATDEDARVATRAIESLGSHPEGATRAFLHRVLESSDNGRRLAAVLALRAMPDPSDREPLERAFRTSEGDIAAEVAFNVLENLGAMDTEEARAFVLSAVEDPRPWVQSVARRIAERLGAPADAGKPAVGLEGPAPHAPEDYPLYRFNPLIEVATTRGALVFELFPAETPVHVHNFIQLARNGAYDGLTFHRVVPDFVVQGGDYRGDGNGSRPWYGAYVPHELTTRKTTRGSLGMPRNEDPDSGGSQFFVTQRPTPHLDGRYTIFGELRQGGDVLDRIEAGDRILAVRPLR
jgi:cyclophilin family peptidyl-prolyl cis-trans isomerase/HEAT repeat protein